MATTAAAAVVTMATTADVPLRAQARRVRRVEEVQHRCWTEVEQPDGNKLNTTVNVA